MCRRGLQSFDAVYTFGEYDGTLRSLIRLFKYRGVRPLEKPLGRLLVRALPRGQAFDAVVPVPLNWRRRWKRGFNQSELLARRVCAMRKLPLERALVRRRPTASQAGLTSAERRKNVAGAFAVARPEAISAKHIVLVDDVMTTGATLAAAASVLKKAGAARVTVLTLARADRRKPGFRLDTAVPQESRE